MGLGRGCSVACRQGRFSPILDFETDKHKLIAQARHFRAMGGSASNGTPTLYLLRAAWMGSALGGRGLRFKVSEVSMSPYGIHRHRPTGRRRI